MSILSAILQGILQGLTEFLPVSSSGHLSLYQYFTGINSESSVTFSVMLHLGTLLAVIIAFWPTVWQLLKEFFLLFADLFRGRLFKQPATPYRRMLYLLILSCVPLLLVLPLQELITSVSADNDILVEGICFLITSALLFLADRAPRGHRDASTMKGKHALAIGVAQLFATLPGISRSGSTISVGQLCGLERSYAVSYSFILGLPAVLAAGILDLHDAATAGIGIEWGTAIIGMAVGTLCMTVFGSLFNALYLIPKFAELFHLPIDQIVAMGTAVNKGITSVPTLVLFAVVPFNLIKGVVDSALTYLLYKRVEFLLFPELRKKEKVQPQVQSKNPTPQH